MSAITDDDLAYLTANSDLVETYVNLYVITYTRSTHLPADRRRLAPIIKITRHYRANHPYAGAYDCDAYIDVNMPGFVYRICWKPLIYYVNEHLNRPAILK